MTKHNDSFTGASFSLTNRALRVVWGVMYLLFFRFSPRILHGWRRLLLKLFGAKVGRGVHVYPAAIIWAPWNLVLEDECGIGDRVILYSQDRIRIGYRAVVSQGSHICTGTHDYTKKGQPLVTSPINIGAHSWIAAECFVHPGITIGEGAVIGARSVVSKNMPPWMVCVGNPCKPIKSRRMLDL